MSILEYNGGACIAMAGRECVAIASDTRLGVQAQTVSFSFSKTLQVTPTLFVGLTGLATDVQTVRSLLRFRANMFKLREAREMKCQSFGALLSHMLYERRFAPWFVEPVVCGLEEGTNKPYLSGMDLIGAPVFTDDFVVAGTCTENLHGMCEAMYKPDMEPDELFETISQCLLSAVDRDALSGWGATVSVITKDGVTTRELKARQD